MTITVEGVKIELTPEQISTIKKEKDRRARSKRSFSTVLKQYGFKKLNTEDWEDPKQDCYQHEKYNWFADIINGGVWSEVWMIGEGLKTNNGFPGGWNYDSPQDVEEELISAIDKKEKQ